MDRHDFCNARHIVLADAETRLPSAANICGLGGTRASRACKGGRAPDRDELLPVMLLEEDRIANGLHSAEVRLCGPCQAVYASRSTAVGCAGCHGRLVQHPPILCP